MRVLLLPLGDGTWCLPLEAVREVLVVPPTTPLPTGPPALVGLFNLRGSVLPLFDTAGLLSLPGVPPAHVAVVEVPAGLAGLASSGTPRAARLGRLVGAPEHPAALGTYTVEAAGAEEPEGGTRDVAVLLDVGRLLT